MIEWGGKGCRRPTFSSGWEIAVIWCVISAYIVCVTILTTRKFKRHLCLVQTTVFVVLTVGTAYTLLYNCSRFILNADSRISIFYFVNRLRRDNKVNRESDLPLTQLSFKVIRYDFIVYYYSQDQNHRLGNLFFKQI